jgi:sec-independent protein translocase protein TatA
MSFFDAPWHIVLVLLAALLLFGSSRLPGAAKALGSSMNIFKKAVKGDDDDQQVNASSSAQPTYTPPPAQLTSGPAAPPQQAQIDALQRQLNELQRQAATGDQGQGTPPASAESQPNRQSY